MWKKLGFSGVLGLGIVGSMVVVAALRQPASSDEPGVAQRLPISAHALIQGQTIELEVAKTKAQQQTGLMFRHELPEHRGMLFELSKPKPQVLWTKDLNFEIDIVFLLEGEVQAVIAEVPPCPAEPCPVYGINTAVDQVLELKGGRANELKLVRGKKIMIREIRR